MISTKQFTILFLLVTVFLVAISIVAALAVREATTTYDTTAVHDGLHVIIEQAAEKIAEQEAAMQFWADEAGYEVRQAADTNRYFCDLIEGTIGPLAAP